MKEMKKNFRKITSLVVALAVMVTAVVFDVPGTVVAEATVKYGGTDNGLNWVIDDSGTLTISGSGAMANYSWVAIGQKSSASWGGYKTSVTAIVIEDGVTSIGNYAFYNLTNVETVSIADSVTSIGNEVFRECSKIKSIEIPNSVKTIGRALCQKCTSLTSISIPESVTSLGGNAFDDCTNLLEVTVPGSLKSISSSVFRNCSSLKSVTIPSTITSIGDYAFINCRSLTSIDIPSGVTGIATEAFSGCSTLTSITIPSGVTSIGNNAFKDCAALNTATFECIDPPTLGGDAVFTGAAVIEEGGKIYVPCGAVEAYKTADNWSAHAGVITNNGHKVAKHITAKDPTCTETGNKEYWTCGCGEEKYSNADGSAAATDVTIPVDANAHDWGDWSVSEHPAISTDGEAKRTCQTNNAHAETKPIPKLTDTVWIKNETTKPTVSGTGSYTYTSDYGTVTVTVPKLTDTVWTKTETTKPTINTDGEYTYTSDYGTVTVNDVPKLTDIVWTKVETTKPTINTDGEYTYTSDYGTVTISVPELTNPLWTKEETQKPTEDKDGKYIYTSAYGEVTVTIPPIGHEHTLTHVPEVPATETTEGTKEHWHCEGCGKDFADENGEKEITSDELKIGKIEKEVQSGENAPTAELTTPKEELIDAVLTSEEQAVINDGKDVKIILTIEDATESVSSVDKTAVESKIESLTNYHLGQYLDVNLLKMIDGETEKIAETSAPITITFEIPAELRVSGRSYSVIRVHGGETTVLPDLDNDPNTVTIETDKFSTYALAYVENASASDPSGGNSGGSRPNPTPTPGGNPSGTTPSGGNPSGGNGNSGAASGNGNSTANESGSPINGSDSSNDRNEDDPSDIEDDSFDVEDDFSDDDDDSIDVDEDSSAGEGDSESGNSDQAVNASSEDTAFSVDEEGHVSDESDSNPSTGVAVSFIPLAAAITVLMAAKRKKK